jgi:AraC-like DNA-binding protein/tetratricopeptide (TPR) repeat protein
MCDLARFARKIRDMPRPFPYSPAISAVWELARSGNLRGATEAARNMLVAVTRDADSGARADLHLVEAFCAMRQGHHADALRMLDAAGHAAAAQFDALAGLRVECWRAELAYFQGRYAAANEIIERTLEPLKASGDFAYAAFAQRTRIAILLARADYDAIQALAGPALTDAEGSGDDYVLVQVLNLLGAVQFDRATSKLPEPHARAHLSSIDPRDAVPMESDAREALRFFERAREVAERAKYEFAAWYVAGNIERLEILLGRADRVVHAIRKRLHVLQERGAKYDEIVTRSNLAWGLRTLGRHKEALHEIDAALALARETGTFNVQLEFLHYDRSVVLDALGDRAGARASYRRYLRLVNAWNRGSPDSVEVLPSGAPKRPLEPFFLKRADRFVADHMAERFPIERLAQHCEVSWRTLQKAFAAFRGITPVAYVRNMRLDEARRVLDECGLSVAEVASRCGFQSPTTFTLEYRKRFGTAPTRARRRSRG